jgi:hypothetical protein
MGEFLVTSTTRSPGQYSFCSKHFSLIAGISYRQRYPCNDDPRWNARCGSKQSWRSKFT